MSLPMLLFGVMLVSNARAAPPQYPMEHVIRNAQDLAFYLGEGATYVLPQDSFCVSSGTRRLDPPLDMAWLNSTIEVLAARFAVPIHACTASQGHLETLSAELTARASGITVFYQRASRFDTESTYTHDFADATALLGAILKRLHSQHPDLVLNLAVHGDYLLRYPQYGWDYGLLADMAGSLIVNFNRACAEGYAIQTLDLLMAQVDGRALVSIHLTPYSALTTQEAWECAEAFYMRPGAGRLVLFGADSTSPLQRLALLQTRKALLVVEDSAGNGERFPQRCPAGGQEELFVSHAQAKCNREL